MPNENETRPIHISGYERRANDFYATPDWVTHALLQHISFRGPVWEPCCGTGAMAEAIAAHGLQVIATDINEYGYGRSGVDFFACRTPPDPCQSLITNPPYGNTGTDGQSDRSSVAMLDFVRHAMTLAESVDGQLALLVRFQWLAGKRAAALLSSGPFIAVIALTKRIRWFDRGALTNSAQHHHAWIVFDYQRRTDGEHRFNPPPRLLFANDTAAPAT